MKKLNPNDPMYFKTLGYDLGVLNTKHNTNKSAEEVASNLFAGHSKDKADFILYYNLGIDAVGVESL
jgi:hypothetical protein